MKSMNMISTTGRRPTAAAPTVRPMMVLSLIGVLTTRFAPKVSASPPVTPNGPPRATSSPNR